MLGTKPVEVSSFPLNVCLTSPRGFNVHLPDNSWYFSCDPCSLVDIIFDSENFSHFKWGVCLSVVLLQLLPQSRPPSCVRHASSVFPQRLAVSVITLFCLHGVI